jgi:hypothetical protein
MCGSLTSLSAADAGRFDVDSRNSSKPLERAGKSAPELIRYLRENPDMLDLDEKTFAWAAEVENAAPDSFRGAHIRSCHRFACCR